MGCWWPAAILHLGWKDEESQLDISSEHVLTTRDNPVSKNSFGTSGKKRKSKAEIQRELLGVKRTARYLKQQGKHEEAEEQLRTVKVLEIELIEIENPSIKDASSIIEDGQKMVIEVINDQHDPSVEVFDRDMVDPEFSEALKGLGWRENEPNKHSPALRSDAAKSNIADVSKAQVNIRAASEVDVLPQLAESETVSHTPMSLLSKTVQAPSQDSPEISKSEGKLEDQDEMLYNRIKNVVSGKEEDTLFSQKNWSQGEESYQKDEYSCREIIKVHKVKALALKREGKIAEAREELRQSKLLEKSLVDGNAVMVERKQSPISASAPHAGSPMEEVQLNTKSSPLSSRERFKLQQQCLALKRRAHKLQMEGKGEEERELALKQISVLELLLTKKNEEHLLFAESSNSQVVNLEHQIGVLQAEVASRNRKIEEEQVEHFSTHTEGLVLQSCIINMKEQKDGPGTLMRLSLILKAPPDCSEQHCQLGVSDNSLMVLLSISGKTGRFIMSKWLRKKKFVPWKHLSGMN